MVGTVVQICWHCFVVIKPAVMLIVRGGGKLNHQNPLISHLTVDDETKLPFDNIVFYVWVLGM